MGYDGKPLALAHVRLLDEDDGALATVQVDQAGAFAMDRKDVHGAFARLEFTGTDHERGEMLVPVQPQPVEVTIRMATPEAPKRPTTKITLAVADPKTMKPTLKRPMVRQRDGTWAVELTTEATSLVYELKASPRNTP